MRLLGRFAVAGGLVGAITAIDSRLLTVNSTTATLTYVVAILLIASRWGGAEAAFAAFAATLFLNLFFLPPVGRLTIADPENWTALAVFLITALVAGQLSDRARRRATEALGRQADLERLYAFSRALLLSPGKPTMPAAISRHLAEAFDFDSVAVYDHRGDDVCWSGAHDVQWLEPSLRETSRRAVTIRANGFIVLAIQLGGAPLGSLAIPDTGLSDTVVQSIANLVAIGLERSRGQEMAARAEVARQSGELRATMLDALAHEFKTPLTSMKVAAGDLRSNAPDDRRRELATIIDEDLDRLRSLVTDTVQMVRVDSGDFTLHPNDHQLLDIVQAAVRTFEPRLDGHTVDVRVPDGLGARVDRELLALALRQLLDNAVKYSPATAAISISASEGNPIHLVVANSGPPIPEREQGRLFERFYRGSQARRVPGTGMGLAIVKQVAEAHGGTLTVSSSEAAGTAFTLSLPREGSHP